MARGLRIHVPDGWYHVMSRGNGGEALYRTDEDQRRFLGPVAELPRRFRAEVHAFVLMDNHYHLLVRCRRTDLSENLVPAEYWWSSWRVDAGPEAAPGWLSRDRIQPGCGGRGIKAQRAALVAYPEATIQRFASRLQRALIPDP